MPNLKVPKYLTSLCVYKPAALQNKKTTFFYLDASWPNDLPGNKRSTLGVKIADIDELTVLSMSDDVSNQQLNAVALFMVIFPL